ncbi:DUF7577 domain-containing protein [Roseimaritima sediminicola]|uniref:DUF7577 domain-containing protein n=1 Tax=Roseimaritima sediminicola TaxID=2662066 RepID=UPI0012984ECC|nr:DUF2007 domain-containing protein [Roseimaritima sediminicola]
MSDSRRILREAFNFLEAETIRLRLQEAGIEAFVTGTDAAVALSMGGAGTDRLVRVEVDADDFQRADQLLVADQARMQHALPWICSRCGEQNEPAFEICWSCSKPLREEDQRGRTAETGREAASREGMLASQTPTASIAPDAAENPYRPTATGDPVAQRRMASLQRPDRAEELEDRVRRAFLSSIVGLLVCPPLVNLYSVGLLLSFPAAAYEEPELQLRLFSAWLINVASIIVWPLLYLSM